jgi:hypothetical protein
MISVAAIPLANDLPDIGNTVGAINRDDIGGLGLNSLLNDKGLLASNTLLGSILGKDHSILAILLLSNHGNILKTLGESLSKLTGECNTILSPLTGARNGILTKSLLQIPKLLGDLTDEQQGSLRELTYHAFSEYCKTYGNAPPLDTRTLI